MRGVRDILLSGHRLEKSSFAGVEKIAGLKLRDISHDSGEYMKSLDFCTIQAFKGLERKVVIAVDLLALDKPVGQRLHYCGLSRARTMLVVMLGEGGPGGGLDNWCWGNKVGEKKLPN